MQPLIVRLFTHPDYAWNDIRDEEEQHPRHYLAHLLLWALLPTLCLFIGTTWVGWSLAEDETVRLSFNSALQLCLLMYLSMLAGTAVMGGFIRWMSHSFEARPTLNQCIGFAAYVATPFFLSGITALYPSRWLAVPALMIAGAYSTYLLFVGLPRFMRINQDHGLPYAASVWGVGLLVLVTIMVSMILFWLDVLSPEYLRSTLGA